MISNEERREVAKRLRFCAKTTNGTIEFSIGLSHWVGIDGVTDDQGNLFSTQADRREAELTLEKLADLIDPTTHIGVNEHGRAYCPNCECDDWCLADRSRFCPNCGCRCIYEGVVDDE